MARYDDPEDEFFDYGSLPEVQQQEFLYELVGFKQDALDREARDMFWDVMYNDELRAGTRQERYQELVSYLYDEYGLIFEEIWDWEDFRRWYDAA